MRSKERQLAQLVVAAHVEARGEIAGGDALRLLLQRADRRGGAARDGMVRISTVPSTSTVAMISTRRRSCTRLKVSSSLMPTPTTQPRPPRDLSRQCLKAPFFSTPRKA
jgi:hypothetical protein